MKTTAVPDQFKQFWISDSSSTTIARKRLKGWFWTNNHYWNAQFCDGNDTDFLQTVKANCLKNTKCSAGLWALVVLSSADVWLCRSFPYCTWSWNKYYSICTYQLDTKTITHRYKLYLSPVEKNYLYCFDQSEPIVYLLQWPPNWNMPLVCCTMQLAVTCNLHYWQIWSGFLSRYNRIRSVSDRLFCVAQRK